jgi:hypothetical protein
MLFLILILSDLKFKIYNLNKKNIIIRLNINNKFLNKFIFYLKKN